MERKIETGEVVQARAPGKIIICGEHAVVHGTAAVAAALNLYTTVKINRPTATEGEDEILSLSLPGLNMWLKWPIRHVKESLDFARTEMGSLETVQSEKLKTAIEDFLKREMPSNADKGAHAGLAALFFLYCCILGVQPLELVITSELPVGAGLGSSAAFCVALCGALLTLAGKLKLQKDDLKRKWIDIEDKERDLVNMWAFEGEKIIHGKPSGVDNNVSCYGHVVCFKKGNLTRLDNPMQLRMLITNTKVSRNTKALVAGVAERTCRHPVVMAEVFKAVDAMCEEVVNILQSPFSKDQETQLAELLLMNEGLLNCMGVSHHSIETICQTTLGFNLSSKLTGAGGGGCVVTLLPNDASDALIQNVKAQLETSGFECFEVGIGGKGLQMGYCSSLWPVNGQKNGSLYT